MWHNFNPTLGQFIRQLQPPNYPDYKQSSAHHDTGNMYELY